MPQFILKIDLGNDAMSTAYHVGSVLKTIASRFESNPEFLQTGAIYDYNGNVVGHYEVVDS